MPSLGTFGSFGIARMGIYAASSALNVTGNNIANINTVGYCRQKLDLSAMRTGGSDQYSSSANLYFGSGVMTDSISQYRDPYLDIRFRNENTQASELDTYLSGLDDLARILDEVAKGDGEFGILEAQFNDLVEQLQNLSEKAGSEEYDTLVRSSANTLAQLFNSYAEQLETVEENTLLEFEQDIDAVNAIITNIRDMNEQIWKSELHGDPALVLRDERNLLIDQLSGYIGIDVEYTTEVLGMVTEAQNLTITIAGTNIELINGVYATQLTVPEEVPTPNPDYDDTDPDTMQWLNEFGKPTNNISEAAVARNDAGQMIDAQGNVVGNANLAALMANPSFVELMENAMPYLDANGDPTDDPDAADLVINPAYALTMYQYLDGDGNPTDDVNAAKKTVNPAYDAVTNPTADQWMLADGSGTTNDPALAAAQNLSYSGTSTAAQYLDAAGVPTNNAADAALVANPNYDTSILPYLDENGEPTLYPYVDASGNPTNILVNPDGTENTIRNPLTNNEEDYRDNAYLIELAALTDKNGSYIINDENRKLDDAILLNDVVLSGSLQAHRELLTEEGEFSSDFDIGMDDNATTKRGIPYYRYALDGLAQQFAAMFNENNTLTPGELFGTNEKGQFMDYSQDPLLNYDVVPAEVLLDGNGNPVYPPIVVLLPDGTQTYLTEDNIYDEIPDGSYYVTTTYNDDGTVNTYTYTPIDEEDVPTFEHLLYQNGGQAENYKTNSDGEYLKIVVDEKGNPILDPDGSVQYEPIYGFVYDDNGNVQMENVLDENGDATFIADANGDPILDANGNIQYILTEKLQILTQSNLTPENLDKLEAEGVTDKLYVFDDMYEHNGEYYTDKNGNTIQYKDENGITQDLTIDKVAADPALFEYLMDTGVLTEPYSNFQKAGVLISNNSNGDDDTGITAANISISRSWSIGETRIVLAKGKDVGSSENSNVINMISNMDKSYTYDAQDIVADASNNKNEYFKGSFQEMLINTVSTLAQDQQNTTTLLVNYNVSVLSLDNSRISVSGVDLNEEAANMMQFQQAYTASARMLTVLDEVLDTLLNTV